MTESKEIEILRSRPVYIIAGIAGLIAISASIIAFSDNPVWSNITINATLAVARRRNITAVKE
jgi:hypothetical protein